MMTVTVCVCLWATTIYVFYFIIFFPLSSLKPFDKFREKDNVVNTKKTRCNVTILPFFFSLLLVPYLSLACRALDDALAHTSNSIIVIFFPFPRTVFNNRPQSVFVLLNFSLSFFSSPFGHRLSSTSRWRPPEHLPYFHENISTRRWRRRAAEQIVVTRTTVLYTTLRTLHSSSASCAHVVIL